jgi:hypothetical protein
MQPMRLFRSHQHRHGDGHVLTLRSRFIPEDILDMFERRTHGNAGYQAVPATETRRARQIFGKIFFCSPVCV